ncbi:MAG: hypothetical protein H6959_07450 [Chromatiaceae bacterium]|nr:hypothetical protein [Chromatiaceae bacterium]MCP5422740.1 hypothetical protein [Chromatiaceae bacterium]
MKTIATFSLAVVLFGGAGIPAAVAADRYDNPPGPVGGPGANRENPPGMRGGPGMSRDQLRSMTPEERHEWQARERERLKKRFEEHREEIRAMHEARRQNPPGPRGGPGHDRDFNPPGPRGGPGTDWENPPGPRSGPGWGPDRRRWDNPPGPAGGPGRGWRWHREANPPDPRGGPGANW